MFIFGGLNQFLIYHISYQELSLKRAQNRSQTAQEYTYLKSWAVVYFRNVDLDFAKSISAPINDIWICIYNIKTIDTVLER